MRFSFEVETRSCWLAAALLVNMSSLFGSIDMGLHDDVSKTDALIPDIGDIGHMLVNW